MSFKKEGFINIHQKDVSDLTAKLLSKVCHDVQVESTLLPLTGHSGKKVLDRGTARSFRCTCI